MKRESSGEGQVNGKRKWILSVVVAVIAALVVFAPMPVPHFADFTTVCDTDGQEVDVTIKVRFVHFKPLFFQYGENAGYFPIGSIKIYDNVTEEEICDLKLKTKNDPFGSKNIYTTMFFESFRPTIEKIREKHALLLIVVISCGMIPAIIW